MSVPLTSRFARPVALPPIGLSQKALENRAQRHAWLSAQAEALFGVKCISITAEISEGGWLNFVDYLLMDTNGTNGFGPRIVARIARQNKLDRAIVLQAEIDTMLYVRAMTEIPVPRLYGYRCVQGVEQYMFMEHIDGEQLREEKGRAGYHDRALQGIASVVVQLAELRFPAIGCLAVQEWDDRGQPVGIDVGPLSSLDQLRDEQFIGPQSRGPWTSSSSFYRDIAVKNLARAMSDDFKAADHSDWSMTADQWDRARDVYPQILSRIDTYGGERHPTLAECATTFTLAHNDLNAFNIIVRAEGPAAGRVVGIIDWELAGVVPLWSTFDVAATHPLQSEPGFRERLFVQCRRVARERGHDKSSLIVRAINDGEVTRGFVQAVFAGVECIDVAEEWLETLRV